MPSFVGSSTLQGEFGRRTIIVLQPMLRFLGLSLGLVKEHYTLIIGITTISVLATTTGRIRGIHFEQAKLGFILLRSEPLGKLFEVHLKLFFLCVFRRRELKMLRRWYTITIGQLAATWCTLCT
jgi:hypothetical protein